MTQIEKLVPGDVIEFIHPVSKKSESGKHGTGRFTRTIQRRGTNKVLDIEVVNGVGEKIIIQDNNIRWERTMYFKEKQNQVQEINDGQHNN
ncbi:hypothetical protein KAU33_15895 [Candidatus Dependentiae bacterium]|nr:hypothetical protein [Candidatus Dependentiae bacterium]